MKLEKFNKLIFEKRCQVRQHDHVRILYRNDEHGLQKEEYFYNPNLMGKKPKDETYFFIDGDPREFTTAAEIAAEI